MLSVLPNTDGNAIGGQPIIKTNRARFASVLAARYVTGTHGKQRHWQHDVARIVSKKIDIKEYAAHADLVQRFERHGPEVRGSTRSNTSRRTGLRRLMLLATPDACAQPDVLAANRPQRNRDNMENRRIPCEGMLFSDADPSRSVKGTSHSQRISRSKDSRSTGAPSSVGLQHGCFDTADYLIYTKSSMRFCV